MRLRLYIFLGIIMNIVVIITFAVGAIINNSNVRINFLDTFYVSQLMHVGYSDTIIRKLFNLLHFSC